MKIYTKTGDQGDTSLFGGKRVSKADLKIDQADLIFCLDFSCLDRIADLRPKIEASLAFKAIFLASK